MLKVKHAHTHIPYREIMMRLLLLVCIVGLAGCGDRAPSNVKVMMTRDCGVNWEVIPPGTRVPTGFGSCEYKTVLPDYPMQGDTEFLTQFKGNILVKVRINYDYEIIDGLKFLKEAKFLGKQGSADAASSATKMDAFETAENVVIDVRLRELVTSSTLTKDIVEFNPSAFEDNLFKEANKLLADRGVKINSMALVTIPEDQTRMAIDAATAMSVYASKGMSDLGRQLTIARAGATQVHVHTAPEKK